MAPIFIKLLTGVLDSWTQNALRYGVACLFWLPFLVAANRNGSFDRRIWKLAILPSAINLLSQSCFTASFYYIHPAFVDLTGKSSILWIIGISLILFARERALLRSKRFWSGIILSAAGLLGVMAFHADFGQKHTMTGIVLTQIAAACWAAYTLIIRVRFADIDSRCCFAVISLYSTAGLTVLAILVGHTEACLAMSVRQWFWVVFSAITGIAISHVMYYCGPAADRGDDPGNGHAGGAVLHPVAVALGLRRDADGDAVAVRRDAADRGGAGHLEPGAPAPGLSELRFSTRQTHSKNISKIFLRGGDPIVTM